ncbi:carbon storage regulator CsrA [Nitrospira sp. Kam-Ns4a]
MLVLTRRAGEGIAIGTDIHVVVLEVKGLQVRLGIEAPPQVQVHRDEVYARILDENRQAAATQRIPAEVLTRLGRTGG